VKGEEERGKEQNNQGDATGLALAENNSDRSEGRSGNVSFYSKWQRKEELKNGGEGGGASC